jgi:type IV pilus assembly protein PilY1
MEFQTDGTFPECNPADSAGSVEKSRWIDLVEVLTGRFNGYSCWAQDRSTAAFQEEFSLGGRAPYDFGYVNPYHRALSNGCTYGPGVLPPANNPFAWPDKAVNTYPFSGGAVVRPAAGALPFEPPCALFNQDSDGLLDIYKDQVRFGLMTFDTRVSAGTGLDGSDADHISGNDGHWSYYRDWRTGSATWITGHPENCDADLVQEIGARNAAAPPWEGRMIAFGPPDLADNTERNGWIQDVLLSTRPYGATPIAGQLSDAREFLWSDDSDDPFDATKKFGPRSDPNWTVSSCRKTIMILLTDGEPNLDLRPFCEAEGPRPGRCPYDEPAEIVSALRRGTATERHEGPTSTNLQVETYVIGFALGEVTLADGTSRLCADLDPTLHCGPANETDTEDGKKVQACCTLNEIAAAGSTPGAGGVQRKAYFAEDRTQLRAIFTDILDDVVQVATRTMPVFSGAGGDSSSKGFKFFSAFDPQPNPEGPALWEGVLERRRFVCAAPGLPTTPPTPPPPPEEQFNPADGDDFAANVNGAPNSRNFITVVADDTRKSIRPFITTNDDGIGISTGTQVFAAAPGDLLEDVSPESMQVTAADCVGAGSAEDCRDLILGHAVGIDDGINPSRCSGGECRVFGGIFHSTPTVVPGRPSELLRDESYAAFTEAMADVVRPAALYTSTVDGFLHAFNLAPFPGSDNAAEDEVDTPENNEFWSFIPPAVLPVMQNQYPATPAILLDGLPIIKDVVSRDEAGNNRFERLQSQAQEGIGDWRTVLLQGFGEGQVAGGFFALDITTPHLGEADPPTFLWQLTQGASGEELFGSGGTPLITTVFLNVEGEGPREVAVAVLPGGDAIHGAGPALTTGPVMEADPPDFKTERFGRNYPSAEAVAARSLTIVRLDTGEVVRTFRPAAGAPSFNEDVFTETDIPAPITGQPKAFPELTGAVADRIFVGDRDGRMWRVDIASRDPADWSMQVFYDAFEDGDETDSQPVILAPVLSVNDEGSVTVAFATGDQEVKGAPVSMVNRVVSLTEGLDDDNDFFAKVNWVDSLTGGDRVTGPMVLFNSGLYYTSSRPPATVTNTCDVGRSTVHGAHFEDSVDVAADAETPSPLSGPAPAPGATDVEITSNAGLVFGLSLEVEPTCASSESTISGNDSFGYGTVRMTTTVQPARFFLTYAVSGSADDPRGVLEVRQELESPHLPVSFESWAMIYE